MAEKRRINKYAGIIIACVILLISIKMTTNERKEEEAKRELPDAWKHEITQQLEQNYFMLPFFLQENSGDRAQLSVLEQVMAEEIPLYDYLLLEQEMSFVEDDGMDERGVLMEGSDEDRKEIDEAALDYDDSALHIENSMLEELQRENSAYQERIEAQKSVENGQDKEDEAKEKDLEKETEVIFCPAEYPAYTYDWSETWDYEALVSNFYAIDNTTSLKEEYLDLEKLLYRDLSIEGEDEEGPQILIYHTHSQEAFADSVPGDASTTIVGAGEKLAYLLENEYGFKVLHHKGEYDVDSRDDAYANSLPEIERLLLENPSIEVVIDLHRDEMKEGKKLVMDLQGRPTARFMFFNGMSYIRDKGEISYLENPYIEDNLAFSFQAQVAANEYYPGIARRIYLKAYRYNLHLCPKSMLIELGAQTNTVEEIMNACDPLAHIIAIVLTEKV